MRAVFIGNEAIASAEVTRHELQRWYEPIYPGVYAARGQQLWLRHRTEGAWLWSRPPPGIAAREQLLADDETARVAGLPVTTAVRTAYDLGRYLPRAQAVTRLDALMRATPFSAGDVLLLAERYPAARGLRRLRSVLPLVDGGAASPKETWLRLLNDAGLPTATTTAATGVTM